ncbi:flagellar export chaperone FliS [Mediterraneibacter agrestimuris]|uniref:flagellar export chaperone FliS n=1 Tax=Mediterraneibacter agrestimuris TaxID=2941333 RepID=UPI0020425069|nr:flagellar export chaperone FliS [Mediterraneibacter agrestimuris]
MYQDGYQQYKMQSVNTMTRGEMLLLLYDELIKRLTRAELALEKEDYELFDASVRRSGEIVQYLRDTLNTEFSISRDLQKMYGFFLYELGRLQASRKKAVIEELRPLVIDLRDAFREADKTSGIL